LRHDGRRARLAGSTNAAIAWVKSRRAFPFFTNASLGGSPQANALATEQFWTRMIAFLNRLAAHESASQA
jgi:hypothetical protein